MGNKISFKLDGISEVITGMHVRVVDNQDNTLFSVADAATDAAGNVTLGIGTMGTKGTEVWVYCDNFDPTADAAVEHQFAAIKATVEEADAKVYENIIMLGSSSYARAFSAPEEKAELQELLGDYGLPVINIVTEVQSGSSSGYQADTLMPQAVANNSALENVLFFPQSPTNNVGAPLDSATNLDATRNNIISIISQADAAGWDTVYSNFNSTPDSDTFEVERWNEEFLKPIVTEHAPLSLKDGVFVQDYDRISKHDAYSFSSSDGIHLKEGSGDRLLRHVTASNLARLMGKDPRRSLAGRRFVVSLVGGDPADRHRHDGITPILRGTMPDENGGSTSIGANIIDADTGEIMPDLYVEVSGSAGLNAGRGNDGDTSTSIANHKALLGALWKAMNSNYEMGITIGSFSQTLPVIKSLKLAGSRIATGDDRKGEWTYDGEVKTLDATALPYGSVEFNDMTPVDNMVKLTSALAAGSNYHYLNVIECTFA